jgi:dimethylargininase
MFSKAIVKTPCQNMIYGITSSEMGIPDFTRALKQHQSYIKALKKCGLEVVVMERDENFPDSVFIEDTALLTPKCAVIMRPGVESRRGETESVAELLTHYYKNMETIHAPGTIEAGDIMMGNHSCSRNHRSRRHYDGWESLLYWLVK